MAYEHPFGGWDLKQMSESLERCCEEVASLKIEVMELREALSSMIMQQSPNFGGYTPKNRKQNG